MVDGRVYHCSCQPGIDRQARRLCEDAARDPHALVQGTLGTRDYDRNGVDPVAAAARSIGRRHNFVVCRPHLETGVRNRNRSRLDT
jgi:hypothetical protein